MDSETKHQDPAEPYRTDTAVETTDQDDAVEELAEEQAEEAQHSDSSDTLHGADTGVHRTI